MMDEKNIPFLGIMMLDTNFPRVLGDAGNESSYMFPVRIHIVKGAGSLDLVKDEMPSEEIIQLFEDMKEIRIGWSICNYINLRVFDCYTRYNC